MSPTFLRILAKVLLFLPKQDNVLFNKKVEHKNLD